MTLEIVPYKGSQEARANRWVSEDPENLRRKTIEAARDRDLETLWEIFEAFLVQDFGPSKHTIKAYKQGFDLLLEQLSEQTITKPSKHFGNQFVRGLEKRENARHYLTGKTIKPATIRSRVAAAKGFYAALRWAGATEADPFAGVRIKSDKEAAEDKRLPYPLEAIDELLIYAKPRERAILLLGGHGGLRNGEISALKKEDLHLEVRQLQVQKGKGDKPRRVDLSKRLCEALLALELKPGQAVIGLTPQGIREAIRRLCKKNNVAYQGIHSLRHTAGTRLYRATKDLKTVAKHLGHSKIETAAVYAKFADDTVRNVVTEW